MTKNPEPTNPSQPNDDTLPMLVWLRGDEPFFSNFNMNADQVMDTLGIRRSRLNQISGKELRVGRARIDNYVRPVYRQEDIEEYKRWIRPTATHKKSSDVLDEARSKLEQQSERILQQFSSRFEGVVDTFATSFQQRFLDQRRFSKSMLLIMQKNLRQTLRSLVQRTSLLHVQSLAFWEELRTRFDTIDTLRQEVESTKVAIVQSTDLARYSEKILLSLQQEHKDLKQTLALMQQELEAIRKQTPEPNEFPSSPVARVFRASVSRLRTRTPIESKRKTIGSHSSSHFLAQMKKARRKGQGSDI